MKPILRLGRTGRHSNLPYDKQLQMDPNRSKDSRYIYLSIDEASSHIGSLRNTFFRCKLLCIHYLCSENPSASVLSRAAVSMPQNRSNVQPSCLPSFRM